MTGSMHAKPVPPRMAMVAPEIKNTPWLHSSMGGMACANVEGMGQVHWVDLVWLGKVPK
jgi:hypothetical protein